MPKRPIMPGDAPAPVSFSLQWLWVFPSQKVQPGFARNDFADVRRRTCSRAILAKGKNRESAPVSAHCRVAGLDGCVTCVQPLARFYINDGMMRIPGLNSMFEDIMLPVLNMRLF